MAEYQTERKVLLSIVRFVRERLVAAGWTSVTVVDHFPDNESKIVKGTPGDGEIAIPAMCVEVGPAIEGSAIGIGEDVYDHFSRIFLYIYAESEGQEMDLRGYLANELRKKDITLYNYTASFPDAGAAAIGPIIVDRVNHLPDYFHAAPNVAVRYGGVISMLTKVSV